MSELLKYFVHIEEIQVSVLGVKTMDLFPGMTQSHMANEASITWPHFIGIHYLIHIKNKIH